MTEVRLGQEARHIHDMIVTELASFGITRTTLGRKKRHPIVEFDIRSQHFEITIGGTPSDVRSGLNTRAYVRKLCEQHGLRRIDRRRRKRLDRTVAKPTVSPAPTLADIPATVVAEPPPIPQDILTPTVVAEPPPIPQDVPTVAEPPPIPQDVPTVAEPPPQDVPPPTTVVAEPPPRRMETAVQDTYWSQASVKIASGQQLLYVPRPVTQPVLVIQVEEDLVLVKGEVLVINVGDGKMFHLPQHHLDAIYAPSNAPASSISEALAHLTPPPEQRMPAPPPEQRMASPSSRLTRRNMHGVGAQLGRVLIAMLHVQRSQKSDCIDSGSIRETLQTEQDRAAVSTSITQAQGKGLVTKIGPIPGNSRASYYKLTDSGRQLVQRLGNWPFEIVGLPPLQTNGTAAA